MKGLVLSALAFTLVIFLLGSVMVFELYHAERIYPGIHVWGVNVSGMKLEEAATAIEEHLGINAPLVTLRGPDRSWGIRPKDLGLQFDAQATLMPAYQVGRGQSWKDNFLAQIRLIRYNESFAPILVYDENMARLYLEVLTKEIYIAPTDASLSIDGVTPVATPAQPGRYLDVEATLATMAPAVTRLTPTQVDLIVREIPPTIADAEPARAEAERLLVGPLTLVLANPREGDPGPWVIPTEQLATMLVVERDEAVLHARLNEGALRAYLDGIAPQLVIDPVDARFNLNQRTGQLEPISPSAEGRVLDVGASLIRILQELAASNRYISLVVQAVSPRYPDTATAEEIGVADLVAEGESYFIGSPAGRDHNIRLASTKFHGIVVPPGETFSFNEHLGPVTAEEGYDESYVTAGEQLAIEVGGGICQVSTTAFRAAFWGGYPITERWYHYQRVGYYELVGGEVGTDATVYSPNVDLKFVNDRPTPLLIQTEIDEAAHRLTFRFYSTSDGRRVEKEGPEITDKTEPDPPIYQLDEKMEPGTVKQWQSAVGGLTATIERQVYDAAGNLISHNTFVSKYAPRRASYHYGPGYALPESGTEP